MPKLEITELNICQHGNECNTQAIKEALLREAVKKCDFYASDILIFLSGDTWKGLITSEIKKVQLIFKNSGVDWIANGLYDKEFIRKNHIRSIATITVEKDLEFRSQINMKLVIDYGNC